MIVFALLRRTAVVFAMIAIATPVSGQRRSKPGPGQQCSVDVGRAREPDPPHVALETAQRDSLDAAVVSMVAGRDVGKGYVVLHVDQISGGHSVESVDLKLSKPLLDSLAVAMAVHANRYKKSVVVSIPLQRPGIGTDSVGVRYEACLPHIRNGPVISRYINQKARDFASGAQGVNGSLETQLWLFVSDRGKALTTDIRRSSGNPEFDRVAITAAMKAEFYPALMNGIATPVWVALPIRSR